MKIRIATFAKFVCLKDRAMEITQWAVCEMGLRVTEKHWNQRDKKPLWIFIPGTQSLNNILQGLTLHIFILPANKNLNELAYSNIVKRMA